MEEEKENLSDVADDDFDVPVVQFMNFEQRLDTFGDKGMWFEVGSAVRKNVGIIGFSIHTLGFWDVG